MKQKRKGSRTIQIGEDVFSWYRGKTVTEIRNLSTNIAVHVNNKELESKFKWCDLCRDSDCGYGDGMHVTFPSTVRQYIRSNLIMRA